MEDLPSIIPKLVPLQTTKDDWAGNYWTLSRIPDPVSDFSRIPGPQLTSPSPSTLSLSRTRFSRFIVR